MSGEAEDSIYLDLAASHQQQNREHNSADTEPNSAFGRSKEGLPVFLRLGNCKS